MRTSIRLALAAAGIAGILGVMSGCSSASKPPFQTLSGHEYGYKVEDSPERWVFKVQSVLPPKIDEKYAVYYGYRAIGEECHERGFAYFDAGVNTPTELDGYCYELSSPRSDSARGLNISSFRH